MSTVENTTDREWRTASLTAPDFSALEDEVFSRCSDEEYSAVRVQGIVPPTDHGISLWRCGVSHTLLLLQQDLLEQELLP